MTWNFFEQQNKGKQESQEGEQRQGCLSSLKALVPIITINIKESPAHIQMDINQLIGVLFTSIPISQYTLDFQENTHTHEHTHTQIQRHKASIRTRFQYDTDVGIITRNSKKS